MHHSALRRRLSAIALVFALFPPHALAKTKSRALLGEAAPEWKWRQILASPRIGGRLTAVAVDPRNSKRIFVGTEEGTLVRSEDGGITWDERNLTPFVIAGRSIGANTIFPPDPSDATSDRLSAFVDTPNRFYGDDLPIPYISELFFGINTPNFPPYIVGASPELTLLSEVITSRAEETTPVRRIALCPGALFPVLVATVDAVYGSADDGQSSIRLYFTNRLGGIQHVLCSPWNPNEIVISGDLGLLRSTNGGLSFDTVLSADPNQPSTAAAFGREASHNVPILYDASAGSLYSGDPDSSFGLQYLYPPDDDAESAPWAEIRWIEVTKGGDLWLATDDGVRVSRDGGHIFYNVEPRLFGGVPVTHVLVDSNERVAVMTRNYVHISDDEGVTWHPFFHGITRRTLRQMAVTRQPNGTSRWWVVSSGELWTTSDDERVEGSVDRQVRAWAKIQIENTPPMSITLERVLDSTALSPDGIEAMRDREEARAYIPLLDARLTIYDEALVRGRNEQPIPRIVDTRTEDLYLEFMVLATWPFYEFRILSTESDAVRSPLYELRRQIAFAAEDAWHERMMNLERLERGLSDAEQIAVLKARIEALDAVLDVWGWRNIQRSSK